MIFRYVFVFTFFFSFSLIGNVLDNFKLFTEANYQEDESNKTLGYDYLIGGVFLDKELSINDTSNLYVSWYVKSSENIDGSDSVDMLFKQAYVEFLVQNLKVKLGRSLIDLSTSKMYSVNSFLSPVTFILDPTDRSLNKIGLDGLSLSGIKSISLDNASGNVDLKWLLHVYKNLDNEDFTSLLQVKNINRFADSSVFVGVDRDKDFFVSGSTSLVLNDNSNIYAEGKYKAYRPSYVLGFDYATPSGIALAVERILKNKEVTTITNNRSDMLGHLAGSDYVGGYLRIPYGDMSVNSIFGFYNLIDKSRVLILQNEYRLDQMKVFFELMSNTGETGSEFDLYADYTLKINLSLNIN